MEKRNKSGNLRGMNSHSTYWKDNQSNQPKLNSFQKNDLIAKAIDWIGHGLPTSEIIDLLKSHAPIELTSSYAYRVLELAHKKITEITKQDAQLTLAVHVGNYEKAYRYFNSIGHVKGMNAAMRGKERLLGLLRDSNKVVINQTTNTTITREMPYDFSKLNSEDSQTLNMLLNKMRVG